MKKFILMLAFVVASVGLVRAQDYVMGEGSLIQERHSVLAMGDWIGDFGVGSAIGGFFPAISGTFEYGLNDTLFGQKWLGWGVGSRLMFVSDFWDGGMLFLSVNTALHFNLTKRFDIAIEAGVVPLGCSFDFEDGDVYFGIIGTSCSIGTRYMFTKSLGMFVNINTLFPNFEDAILFGTIGVSVRL
jgi:hypothetical protein